MFSLCLGLALVACGDDAVVGSESGTGTTGTGSSTAGTETTGVAETSTDTGTGTSTETGTDTGTDTGDEPDLSEPLFAPGTIAEFDIQLSAASLAVLAVDGKIFVNGTLSAVVDGQPIVVPDIGVRLKGNAGSYRDLDEKAAFLLDFNRYVPGQTFLGLKKLAVNNMVQDSSMQREVLGYELFRAGGAPAPRAAHAVVSVNGEPYGLYTTVESIDNHLLLDRWFDDHQGNLYEGAYGSDLTIERVSSFDLDNGMAVDFADLIELIFVLDSVQDPEQFVAIASEVIDLDLYLTTAATGMFLGDWDGYYWSRNNYFLYRRPGDLRWVLIPWGIDQTMRNHLPLFEGIGRITQMCNESLECRAMLAAKYEQVVARVDELALADQAALLGQQLYAAADADPRKPYAIGTVQQAIADNIAFLSNRGPEVLDGLICTDPNLVDDDNDGFNGCGEDCNDGDPNTYPGAPEVCDLDDDDCDGQWDNAPMCPQCSIVALPNPEIGSAAFCFVARSWAAAEADCVVQGGHLMSVHSQAMQTFLTSNAFGIAGGEWWIGLNDIASEGMFTWSDGTPLDYSSWNGGEPNNAGNEDCVNFPIWSGGDWNDLGCGAQARYICRLP